MIPEGAARDAAAVFTETIAGLRLAEGGGFKVASQQRRAIRAALDAVTPALLAHAWDVGYEAGSKWDEGDNPYRPTNE